MKLQTILQLENKSSLRQAAMTFRRFTHPESFDGTPEKFHENLAIAVCAIRWGKAARKCVTNYSTQS